MKTTRITKVLLGMVGVIALLGWLAGEVKSPRQMRVHRLNVRHNIVTVPMVLSANASDLSTTPRPALERQ